MENVVIGLLFALRMLCADPSDPALWLGKLFMIPFFCVHYGMFTAVHGMFVFMLFGGDKAAQKLELAEPRCAPRSVTTFGCRSACWSRAMRSRSCGTISTAASFAAPRLSRLMAKPYGRVMVLHVAIILGGFGAALLGSPAWALVLLVVLKTGLDYRAHVKEHSG